MKRVLLGLVLAVVFYFVGCIVVGGVAGGVAGANNPDHASEAGAQAGAAAVLAYRSYIMAAAAALAGLMAWRGMGRAKDRDDENRLSAT